MRIGILVGIAAALCACGGGGGGGPPGGGGGGTSDGGTGGGGGGGGTSDGGTGGGGGGGTSDGGTDGGGGGGAPDGGGGGGTLVQGGGDWAQYRGGVRGTSENPGAFDAAEVANLRAVWTADLEVGTQAYTQAVLAGDTAYLTTAIAANAIALDASTGTVRWSRRFDPEVGAACGGPPKKRGFWAAPAVVGDVLYLAAPDGHAYALRRQDGSTIWASAIADPTPAGHGEFLQSSPAVSTALGKLYLGIASSEHCDEVRGKIAAIDLATGAAVVKPLVPEGRQGGGIWSSISIDEGARLVFASTANRIGDISAEPLAQSIVSFRADTLEVVDHWQNPTTLENSDFGASPTLFDAPNGDPLVAAANKDGMLYVLRRDRLSAGPVWKARLAVIDPNKPNEGGDPTAGFGSLVSPTFAHGLLYAAGGRTPVPGEAGSVVAFEPATGTVVWKHVTLGYVLAAMPAVGDILIVESGTVDFSGSWLDVLDARTGALLRRFPSAMDTMTAPSVARGLILWSQVDVRAGTARVTALAAPKYRP